MKLKLEIAENEIGPLTPLPKINLKLIKYLNIRCDIMKLLEETTGKKFLNIGFDHSFLDITPKAQATEVKIRKWDYIKLKSFCTTNDTIYKRKDNLQMRRKYLQTICLIRSQYPKYLKNSYNSITKTTHK